MASYKVELTYGTTASTSEHTKSPVADVLLEQDTSGGGGELEPFEDLTRKLSVPESEIDEKRNR